MKKTCKNCGDTICPFAGKAKGVDNGSSDDVCPDWRHIPNKEVK